MKTYFKVFIILLAIGAVFQTLAETTIKKDLISRESDKGGGKESGQSLSGDHGPGV